MSKSGSWLKKFNYQKFILMQKRKRINNQNIHQGKHSNYKCTKRL